MINRISANGLSIPSHQASVEIPNVKHEYITVPPTSQVAFVAFPFLTLNKRLFYYTN